MVVAGGPGSGKSVIALSVMGELARRGQTVLHATGSRVFTQTLRRYAGRGSTRLQGMFKYFGSPGRVLGCRRFGGKGVSVHA
ncbi:DNA/RNA helicase domain-containing protein [Micromonospora endophytica]|uniref:DNA/RNA helicase domain-containing protein n=1 Tax=Micromonospora endophytica TaxID=515350 RepID=UPI0028157BE8|nr:DNA/RNA helicase domain-containing protein [Micromonospora endophytica]